MVKRDVDTSHSGLKEGLETKCQACSGMLKLHVCNLQNIPETSGKRLLSDSRTQHDAKQLVGFDTLHLKVQTFDVLVDLYLVHPLNRDVDPKYRYFYHSLRGILVGF